MKPTKTLTRRTAEAALVAVLYFGAAKVGYAFAFLDTIVSPVWPAAGIAVAMVIILGYHVLWGLFFGMALGSFLNLPDVGLALGIGTASSTGPLINAFLTHRILGDRKRIFNRVGKVVRFIVVCIPLGAMTSALIGTAAVYLNGYGAEGAVWWTILTWFTGDMLGYLIFGSLVLVWSTVPQSDSPTRDMPEAIALIIVIATTSILAFQTPYPLAYAPIVFVIWGTIRFRLHGATLGGAVVAGIAVVFTSGGSGPFIVLQAGAVLTNQSLLLLQLYVALIAISTLLFGSAVVELNDVQDDKGRLEGELGAARKIQFSLIPSTVPAFPERKELSIHSALEPAKHVGGDFYDYFFVSDDILCVCIADVAGKGVPAALFMAVTRTLVEANAAARESTAEILTRVNGALSRDNESSTFVTMFLGLVNVRSGRMIYTNAGHNPPYLRRHDGTWQRLDDRHGPILGAVEEIEYQESTGSLASGDVLFLYTDGVTEAMDDEGQLFTEDRLVGCLRSSARATPESTVRHVLQSVKRFEGSEQADDITMLALQLHDEAAV